MTDTLSRTGRSSRMALIRAKGTVPEKTILSIVRNLGYRPNLNDRSLPGSPDIVFPRLRKVIFVHGCFWHRHPSARCKLARLPKSRQDFWFPKLAQNRARDLRNQRTLNRTGWSYIAIWECQIATKLESVELKIKRFLTQHRGKT